MIRDMWKKVNGTELPEAGSDTTATTDEEKVGLLQILIAPFTLFSSYL